MFTGTVTSCLGSLEATRNVYPAIADGLIVIKELCYGYTSKLEKKGPVCSDKNPPHQASNAHGLSRGEGPCDKPRDPFASAQHFPSPRIDFVTAPSYFYFWLYSGSAQKVLTSWLKPSVPT